VQTVTKEARGSMKARPPDLPGSLGGFRSVLVVAVLAALVVVWAATNLLLGEGFAVLVSDKGVGGEEASALVRLFAALVLVVLHHQRHQAR
jgi:hypothetical protein